MSAARLSDEFLADCGRRVLSVIRGVPRRQVDTLAAEIAILIGTLCPTLEAATKLTARLVAQPLPRWDWQNLQRRAAQFASSADPKPDSPDWCPIGFNSAEFQALLNRGQSRQLDPLGAYEALQAEAREFLARLATTDLERLITECREEWKRLALDQYPTTCLEPFLTRNTIQRMELRIERHLLVNAPLFLSDPT